MTCILAIDPGLTGALAFYWPEHPTRVSVHDMPVVDGKVDGALVARLVEQLRPDIAIIEQVGVRPKEGPVGAFGFGRSFGVVIGVVQALRVPHRLVTPAMWKRRLGLDSDKEKSRARALATFIEVSEHFSRKRDEGRAEAALLAVYFAKFEVAQ